MEAFTTSTFGVPVQVPLPSPSGADKDSWSYEKAFARNLGLVSPEEQDRLRASRVGIIGMGGVGGIHLMTLARLGVGRFSIADPDAFETVNFNRQYGATLRGLGRTKTDVMVEEARSVNPELDMRVFEEAITEANVQNFLNEVDVLVDGIDFFSIDARRVVFREARRRGIWAVTAGPIGLSTAWLTFAPDGMSFDRYFDLSDEMDLLDQLVAFAVGLTPRATHLGYLDLSRVDPQTGASPSVGLACHLASGVAATESLKILLGRGGVRAVPHYFQFDAYRRILRRGRLWLGNRHPWQRLKRYYLRRRFAHYFPTAC